MQTFGLYVTWRACEQTYAFQGIYHNRLLFIYAGGQFFN